MNANRYVVLIFAIFLISPHQPAMAGQDRLPISEFPAPTEPDAVGPPVRQEQTWKGHLSRQKEPFIEVVTGPKEWSALWLRSFDAPAPELDFSRNVVACVFLGHSADWLFSIDFGEPFLRGDMVVVPYGLIELILELSGPFKAGGQYWMKIFDRKIGYAYKLEETLYRSR